MKRSAAMLSVLLTLALLAAPVPSLAQQAGKVHRIGALGGLPRTSPHFEPDWGGGFREGMRGHGYIEGQHYVLEYRWTDKPPQEAPALAAELVSLKPDLILAAADPRVRAVKEATSTIPIVMVYGLDPVGAGLVASLARPGGNVTGLTDAPLEIEGKRLQLLKEALPKISRVAYLFYPTGESTSGYREEKNAAAAALGLTLQLYGTREPTELMGAFTAMVKAQAEALFVETHSFWSDHRQRIVELAAESRLPAMYFDREFVRVGGLMAYDADRPVFFRRLGSYVDRIFKGAKPGDLPVEQPTKYDLVINLKTAQALGLTIPSSLLMRAEEVLQ